MSAVCDAINARRSCRAFDASQHISDDVIFNLLTLAARAPSGMVLLRQFAVEESLNNGDQVETLSRGLCTFAEPSNESH